MEGDYCSIWIHPSNGGEETLKSYGWRHYGKPVIVFPKSHIKWIRERPLKIIYEDVLVEGKPVLVTHAPLDVLPDDMTYRSNWNPSHKGWLYEGYVGVCGHMIYPEAKRIDDLFYIDTACGHCGPLSAIKFPGNEIISVGEWTSEKDKDEVRRRSRSYPIQTLEL